VLGVRRASALHALCKAQRDGTAPGPQVAEGQWWRFSNSPAAHAASRLATLVAAAAAAAALVVSASFAGAAVAAAPAAAATSGGAVA